MIAGFLRLCCSILLVGSFFSARLPAADNTGAQNTQIGGLAGVGGFTADDVSSQTFWVAGIEACFICQGRLGVFVEYNHYGRTDGARSYQVESADLVSGGLRIQRPSGGVRPYFDVGASGGQDRFRRLSGADATHSMFGMVLGGGVTIDLGKRWYVRPAVRVQVMSGIHVGASVGASFGYRF